MKEAGSSIRRPAFRRLRVFALDPSLGAQLLTVPINETVLKVPWEHDFREKKDLLEPGPVGEYLEVIDHDPASRAFYAPVDLDDPYLLAQDGLPPSVGDPQFHQQMVYAVVMTTIQFFEQALGRVAFWAPRIVRDEKGEFVRSEFVRRLRIYPHALREANAYYSPVKKALLFGYFSASALDRANVPGGTVFTCLSHDIVAHETTHALLDGMHPRFVEATNPDVHALHEAFADLVALFQHFADADVLEHQIARCRGDLQRQNLLGQLAQQFGMAIGRRGALRDALGEVDPDTGEWRPTAPDPTALGRALEPHARGAILVAAVFGAFLSIYKSRIADLLRIATQGTGVLPAGDIHPDLVRRMADEAARSARHVLQMCIRALDYCPPVDVTFGDYLRAIISADRDLYSDDPHHYRVAFIESFRRWGVFPRGIQSLSEDALAHPRVDELPQRDEEREAEAPWQTTLQQDVRALFPDRPQGEGGQRVASGQARSPEDELIIGWDLQSDRREAYEIMRENARRFRRWLTEGQGRASIERFGLTLQKDPPASVYRGRDGETPAVEIHSVRTALRRGPRGALVTELIVEITQRRRGYLDPERQQAVDRGTREPEDDGDFRFRRGCTLLIDPATMRVRYIIATEGNILDGGRLDELRRYLSSETALSATAFYARHHLTDSDGEDFAMLHRDARQEVESWDR
ncbi:MAG: hypothetical protein JXR96_22875 [Deltaproteobacteria bacterium]|nr:hypothetical protein [Deltaproteobacteria bacterium]